MKEVKHVVAQQVVEEKEGTITQQVEGSKVRGGGGTNENVI